MHSLLIFSALLALSQGCPIHGVADYHAADRNIAVAELRKRNWVRPDPRKIAITNVHVFDGFHYSEETSTVVIDGSFIGSDDKDAVVIDGNGGTLMPGLIDNHNHPTTIADLRNLSSYGITTTMCMSCWVASDLCQSLRNQPGLTDFYSAGFSAIVPNSSHSKLAETNPAVNAPEHFIYNTSMCPDWVRDRINTGSDYIKLVAEAYPPSMSQAEHNVIVRTAHENGYWTMTHASTIAAYEMAIDSGTDVIQHTPADEPLSNQTIAKILAGGHYVTPTINIYQNAAAAKGSLGLTDEQTAKINETVGGNVRRMYEAGIPLLAGTDASINSNGPVIVYFGSSLHQELEILSRVGVRNLDVLKAATSRAARAYNMLDRGAVAPGLRADLLLLKGNPLLNISKINEIEKVWIAGIEYNDTAAIVE